MRKLLADALRAFVALPDDDWQPHDWYIAMEAKRLAGEELARLDRAAVRKSSGATMRSRKPTGPSEATREAVRRRSSGRCEVDAPGCRVVAVHMHHRLTRAQGGGHEAENLLLVCDSCHRYIHDQPEYAYERGWLLHRETV